PRRDRLLAWRVADDRAADRLDVAGQPAGNRGRHTFGHALADVLPLGRELRAGLRLVLEIRPRRGPAGRHVGGLARPLLLRGAHALTRADVRLGPPLLRRLSKPRYGRRSRCRLLGDEIVEGASLARRSTGDQIIEGSHHKPPGSTPRSRRRCLTRSGLAPSLMACRASSSRAALPPPPAPCCLMRFMTRL